MDKVQVFSSLVSKCAKSPLGIILDLETEARMSFLCAEGGLQDPSSFRLMRRSILIARYLITEKGDLNPEALTQMISLLETGGHIFYPDGFFDGEGMKHMVLVLKKLQKDPSFRNKICRLQLPLCHAWAETLVRDSLGILAEMPLSAVDVRICVLSALLCSLRQNVGSCFATAPAILIQREQSERLLADLEELLTTGKLKRTFGGVEFSVPLSPGTGSGDLHKVFFIKQYQTLMRSPGLSRALQSMKLDPKKIGAAFEGKERTCVEDFIHAVFLMQYGIAEEDIVKYRRAVESLAKGGMNFSAPIGAKKMAAIEEMLQKERFALASFKAVTDHPLLKAWEFTIASYSEVKMEFSRWNLYSSLGMHHEEPDGIGAVIYQALNVQLQQSNEEVAKLQTEYEIAFDQVKLLEGLLQRASTESEARRLKTEHALRAHHMQSCLQARDKAHAHASWCSSFFPFIMEKYSEKFQEYFQEIYDANMHDIDAELYEDSPAGFRLVYKHGRSNASLWTMICTAQQYIDALADFFTAVELQIAAQIEEEDALKIFSDITTSVVSHIRSEVFLRSALVRMLKAHGEQIPKDPLLDLDSMQKKPWAYTSGGTITTLLKTYYKREPPITEESKWVESEVVLLTFLIDVFKASTGQVEEILSKEERGVLMTSPSHAFIVYPFLEKFRQGWKDPLFTYSWIRDAFINPSRAFYDAKPLSIVQQQFLLDALLKKLPEEVWIHFRGIQFEENATPVRFRNTILQEILSKYPRNETYFLSVIDSFLYSALPLVPVQEWKGIAEGILECRIGEEFEDARFLTARMFVDRVSLCYLQKVQTCVFPTDPHRFLRERIETAGFLPPAPLIFADTNWTGYYFAFLVNPGTYELELWRVDPIGYGGVPMHSWKHWLNGQDPKPWTVYPCPFEYSF